MVELGVEKAGDCGDFMLSARVLNYCWQKHIYTMFVVLYVQLYIKLLITSIIERYNAACTQTRANVIGFMLRSAILKKYSKDEN